MISQKPVIQSAREGFTCEKCNKVFGNEWGLKVHNSIVHSDKRKNTKTLKVSKSSSNGSQPEANVPHYCPNCGCNMRVIALAMKFNANKH